MEMQNLNKNWIKKNEKGITVGEFHFIHKYSEEKIKKIVKNVKELQKESIKMMASDLLHYIYVWGSSMKIKKILLFHCPSTAFALGMKKRDHMAEVVKAIHDTYTLQDHHGNKEDRYKLEIHLALHAFCIKRTARISQHTKGLMARLASAETKFMPVIPFSKTFRRILRSYDAIFILDDVVTTGSTLAILNNMIHAQLDLESKNVIQVMSLGYCH